MKIVLAVVGLLTGAGLFAADSKAKLGDPKAGKFTMIQGEVGSVFGEVRKFEHVIVRLDTESGITEVLRYWKTKDGEDHFGWFPIAEPEYRVGEIESYRKMGFLDPTAKGTPLPKK